MRSDFKLMLCGFCAGLGIGAFALTSVSASIDEMPTRGDRAAVTGRLLTYDDAPTGHGAKAMVAGEAAGVLEYFDARGRLVYRSDPATATTSVAKGTLIPTPTHTERDHAASRMVRADDAPAGASESAN